jgi:transposase-like protein
MQKDVRLADRMLDILINGVSTSRYKHVLPEMAESAGVSKGQELRKTIEAGERIMKEMAECDFPDLDVQMVWIDGIRIGSYHVICAVGLDAKGRKHMSSLRGGAAENAVVVKALLEDLVARGVKPAVSPPVRDRQREGPACGDRRGFRQQRLRATRPRSQRSNVTGHLLKEQHEQARAMLEAAFKLDAQEGTARIEQYARWLGRGQTGAAAPLREENEEKFAINRLGLPSKLRRCLGATNLIDDGHSAARDRMRLVRSWQSGTMALRWTSAASDSASKGLRRTIYSEHVYVLKGALDERARDQSPVQQAAG